MTLTTLIRLPRTIARQQQQLREKDELIAGLHRMLAETALDIQKIHLDQVKNMQGLVCAWLIHLEMPEADIREDLVMLEADLGHQVAKLEEHIL